MTRGEGRRTLRSWTRGRALIVIIVGSATVLPMPPAEGQAIVYNSLCGVLACQPLPDEGLASGNHFQGDGTGADGPPFNPIYTMHSGSLNSFQQGKIDAAAASWNARSQLHVVKGALTTTTNYDYVDASGLHGKLVWEANLPTTPGWGGCIPFPSGWACTRTRRLGNHIFDADTVFQDAADWSKVCSSNGTYSSTGMVGSYRDQQASGAIEFGRWQHLGPGYSAAPTSVMQSSQGRNKCFQTVGNYDEFLARKNFDEGGH